jgi:hypothetical protein
MLDMIFGNIHTQENDDISISLCLLNSLDVINFQPADQKYI